MSAVCADEGQLATARLEDLSEDDFEEALNEEEVKLVDQLR